MTRLDYFCKAVWAILKNVTFFAVATFGQHLDTIGPLFIPVFAYKN